MVGIEGRADIKLSVDCLSDVILGGGIRPGACWSWSIGLIISARRSLKIVNIRRTCVFMCGQKRRPGARAWEEGLI